MEISQNQSTQKYHCYTAFNQFFVLTNRSEMKKGSKDKECFEVKFIGR